MNKQLINFLNIQLNMIRSEFENELERYSDTPASNIFEIEKLCKVKSLLRDAQVIAKSLGN